MLLKGVERIVHGREEDLMDDLGGWTTDELLAEVFKRSTGDRPALQLLQATTIRALLAEGDRKVSCKTAI
jgi:hypothetical protein